VWEREKALGEQFKPFLLQFRLSIVPTHRQNMLLPGQILHQPSEIEHAGLRSTLVIDDRILIKEWRESGGIDLENFLLGLPLRIGKIRP